MVSTSERPLEGEVRRPTRAHSSQDAVSPVTLPAYARLQRRLTMNTTPIAAVVASVLAVCACPASSRCAEVARLDKDNWRLVPGGKEVDAIYGDLLLRNDKVVAVIASDLPNRQLNLRIK